MQLLNKWTKNPRAITTAFAPTIINSHEIKCSRTELEEVARAKEKF